nr:cytochrome C oxidase subunit 6B-1-like [Ipomoea batatas]
MKEKDDKLNVPIEPAGDLKTPFVQGADKTSEIKLETAPADFRFPTTNQTRHCFTRYVEYHRCIAAKGDSAPECDKFAKYYRSLCPGEWVLFCTSSCLSHSFYFNYYVLSLQEHVGVCYPTGFCLL